MTENDVILTSFEIMPERGEAGGDFACFYNSVILFIVNVNAVGENFANRIFTTCKIIKI